MKNNEKLDEVKSGPSWYMGLIGIVMVGFASLEVLGEATLKDAWLVFLGGAFFIWIAPISAFHLNRNVFRIRGGRWRYRTYDMNDLSWIDFGTDKSINLWFGDKIETISNQTLKLKKIRTLIESIGEARLPHFKYTLTERGELSRGQLSACLDCFQLFPPTEIKNWIKLPKSFWGGRKTEKFHPKCPNCQGEFIYTNGIAGKPITVAGIKAMDSVFSFNSELGAREVQRTI